MGIPKQGPVVAVDGPAGTGKSSATRRLAQILGFIHVDTGALYRAVALLTLQKTQDDFDKLYEEEAPRIAKSAHFEFKRNEKKNPANRIYANGKDVTNSIRTPEVSMAASKVSGIADVRAALLGLQRRLGCQGKAILEGRDIGTVIFPDADLKFFLTASLNERAKRRLMELEASGADAPSFEELKKQIAERDGNDATRTQAPLKKAAGAIQVDTTNMTLDEVVESMAATIREKLGLHGVMGGR